MIIEVNVTKKLPEEVLLLWIPMVEHSPKLSHTTGDLCFVKFVK